MRVALVDNGSLEPAAHEALRAAAARIAERSGVPVEAVSWRHSDAAPPGAAEGLRAWTLGPWIRARLAQGVRSILIVPFLVSPGGAIGAALRRDLGALAAAAGGLRFEVTGGLTPAVLAAIVAERVREVLSAKGLRRPALVVVDHGGPSPASAAVRDAVAELARERLGTAVGPVAAASLEEAGPPPRRSGWRTLSGALAAPGFDSGDVVIAPLFLSPGRHAGPGGDLAGIARRAQAHSPGLRCHFTELVGSHPLATDALSEALAAALGAGGRP